MAKEKTWTEMTRENCLLKGVSLGDYTNPCQLRCCLYLQQVYQGLTFRLKSALFLRISGKSRACEDLFFWVCCSLSEWNVGSKAAPSQHKSQTASMGHCIPGD